MHFICPQFFSLRFQLFLICLDFQTEDTPLIQSPLSNEMQLQMEEGICDLNETVKYVAEIDVQSVLKEELRKLKQHLCYMSIIMIIFPPVLPVALLVLPILCYFSVSKRAQIRSELGRTKVYVTESTFVFVDPHRTSEQDRMTVPLTSIDSVIVGTNSVSIKIKPAAPEVIPSGSTHDMQETVVVENIKNPSHLADVVRKSIER